MEHFKVSEDQTTAVYQGYMYESKLGKETHEGCKPCAFFQKGWKEAGKFCKLGLLTEGCQCCTPTHRKDRNWTYWVRVIPIRKKPKRLKQSQLEIEIISQIL